MVFRAQSGGADYYVTVMPFGYNGWSFVSVTETAEADANYAFIRQNTKWLNIAIALAFLACLAVVVPVLLSSQRKLRAEADKQRSRARTDVMTGLYNKAAAEAAAKRALLEDEQRIDALVICDLDGLKSINDSCGHAEGDRAICALADCIHARFRASDVLGRIGGDEFLILLRDIDGETQARGALESLQQSVSGCRIGGDPARPLCVSLGACLTAGGEGYAEVCRRADTALYYVKQNGKNGLAFYTPDMPPIGGRESD